LAGNESYDLGLGRRDRQSVTERLADIQAGAPLAGEAPKPKTIQDISVETGVPWNVIETVVRDSGVAQEQSLALAQDFAQKMKQEIDAGKDIPGAMRSIFGDDAPIEDALKRAVDLAGRGDEGRASSGQNNDNSFAEDFVRSVAGGAITGVGMIAEGAGTLLDVDDLFGNPGITDWAETAGRAVGDTLRRWGQNVKDGMSDDAKRTVRNSTPSGKLFEPSTWKFEGDVSAQGIALLTADVLGSLAPVVIAGIFTGGVGGAAVGGLQGAGAGAQTGRDIVDRATPEQLEANSSYYNELIAKGMTPEAAKEKVKDAAGSLSAVLTAPVSAFGGAFTGRLVNKGIGALSTKGAATRIAGTAAVAGAEEGTQEVLEGVFARTGAELASGLPVDQMEGTFGEFVLGALGGGVIGAGRGAMPSDEQDQTGEAAPDAPLGLPAPDPQLPAPEGDAPDPTARPPLGVLARAAQAAPKPVEPDAPFPAMNAQAGQPVRVTLKNGMVVDAEFVGEDEAGVSLKVNGEPALITRERMEQDGIQIAPVDVVAETAWADAEADPAANFEPLDDTTEPPQQRAERLQGALDTYLSEQQIEATPEDRAEIANSIDRFGGTVAQAVADFQAEMQMEALAQEAAAITENVRDTNVSQMENEPRTNNAENSPTAETPADLPAAQTKEGGLLTEAPATSQTQNDGTAWGAMSPAQREALLVSVGFADRDGNLNAPGRRAAGKGWDDLSERVREKLGEKIDPQAQAGAPVAPGADPNRGLTQTNIPAIEAPEERPSRNQPGVNVLPDGEEPIATPGTRVASDGQPAIGATAEIDERFAANRAALGKFKNGMRVQWTNNNFDPPRTFTGTIARIDRKSGQGTVEVRADNGVGGNGFDVTIGAAQLSPESSPTAQPISLSGKVSAALDKPSVTHLTKKGKTLRGYILNDVTKEEAKQVDQYTFSKDGGFFIRENAAAEYSGKTAPKRGPNHPEVVAEVKRLGGMFASQSLENGRNPDLTLTILPEPSVMAALNAIAGREWSTPPGATNIRRLAFNKVEDARAFIAKMQAFDGAAAEGAPGSVAAAATETEENPTEGQKEAENYKTGKADWQGLKLSVENRKGTERSKKTPDGAVEWSVTMPAHYGRILGTKGADGDHVDFYMGDNEASENVWVIDQLDAETGSFDEHKVMLGFNSATEAKDTYKAGFSDGKGEDRLGAITKMTVDAFKKNLANSRWDGPWSRDLIEKLRANGKKAFPDDKADQDAQEGENNPPSTSAPKDTGPDRPMDIERLKNIDFEEFDDQTREDGQMSPGKREARTETGRWARALVKNLKNEGFTPTLDRKGKPMKPVAFGYAMFGEPDETNIYLTAPNGVQFYAKIHKSVMSRDGGLSILVQFRGEPPKPNYSRPFLGGNRFLEPDLRPSEAAAKVADWAERALPKPKAEEMAAKAPGPINDDPVIPRGYELTLIRRASGDEARANGFTPGEAHKAVVKRKEPYGVYDAIRETRAKAIEAALGQAQRTAPQSKPDQEQKPRKVEGRGILEDAGMVQRKDGSPIWFRKQAETGGVATYQATAVWNETDGAHDWRLTRQFQPTNTATTAPPLRQLGATESAADALAQLRENGMRVGVPEDASARAQGTAPKPQIARSFRDGDKVMVKFTSPDREELMVVKGDPFNSQTQGWSYQVSDGKTGAVNVPQSRVRAATEAEIAASEAAQAPAPEQSADDILNAAFDDVFGGEPEAETATPEPNPDQFEGNETEARRQGREDFARDMPRRLPSYIDPTDAAAADGWYRGWDEANLSQETPGVMPEAPMVDLPSQDPATAWDSASDAERASVFTVGGWTIKGSSELNEAAKRNVQRDWNDLTQAAKNKVKDAIDGGMLLGEYANAERARRDNPQTPPRLTQPRTAGEAAQSAASNAAEGVSNIVDGLNALFGGANKLNSGLTFDRETYEQAKPMFIAAVRAFGRAGQDVMDMAKAMVRGLSANGLTREAQENMRPYLTQFITDMRDGSVDPFAEEVQTPLEDDTLEPQTPETTDEQRGNQEGDQGEPESEEPQEGMGPVGEPDGGPADDGRGESDEDGAGTDADNDEGGSLGDRPGSVLDGQVDQRAGTPPANFIITDDFALGQGTDGEKLAANMAALRLVDTLEKENRYATPEEQATLARWVGWGGLKTVFDGKHEGTTTQWGRAQAELKELLTVTEYADAMRSANDAHYTSRTVVKAMWRAMRNFGFEGGRALEPTIGSGNFLGLQPADLSENTEWFAAELDPVTGKIAKHLYPQAQVFDGMGFQDAPFRRAAFDVAIGNPPFGSTKIGNKALHPDLGKLSVHNFIIAKTGQLLREGGVMGMVVTHRFLDTANPEARAKLAPDFRFLGAVRLPNTAFEENAGTEVTTDIVFFQKRREGDTDGDTTWLETDVEGPNGTRLNRYFAENPDMILGRAAMDGTMYARGRDPNGKGEFTVHADGRDLEAALNEAIDRIEATIPTREEALETATTARENSSTLPYGAMMLAKDGRIFRGDEDANGSRVVQEVTADTFWRDNAEAQGRVVETLRAALDGKASGVTISERLDLEQEARNAAQEAGLIDLAGDPVKQSTKFETALADNLLNLMVSDAPRKDALAALDAYEKAVDRKRLGTDGFDRLSAILNLRQRTRELIALERSDAPEPQLAARRRGLRNAYRKFQRTYGYINNSKNEAILRGDVGPEFALEIGYKAATKDGREETATEAPILEKRVIYPHKLPDNVESVADGLHVSMQERGYIDPAMIAELTGKDQSDVLQELVSGAEPLAFKNPKTGRFEMAEVYLSGNLAEKIKNAQDAGLYQNVPHLENAMPPPKTQDQITPSIRSLWIPPSVFGDFLKAMGYGNPTITLLEAVGMSSIEADEMSGLTEFGKQFDTERMSAFKIFDHAIKGKIPVVYDTVGDANGNSKRVKNEPATREAVAAYERMSKEFPEWAYANPQRAGMIVDAFNEKMNVVTERRYQGVRYLRMVGNSPEISLRNSQKNGAWRMIQDKVTLLHHVVGAGKTFTAIAGVMERKRMGLSRKAVVAVPNHLTGQWGREWLELYPAANILVPTEKDFEPANRAKLINRIATGDFDAVIVGHSQLTKIENDPAVTSGYIEQEITELNAALQEAKRSGESKRTVGQIGTRLNNLKTKLKDLEKKLADRADNKVLGWQDLGVDYLVVDEAHLFKNLEYTTTASQLVGMNPPGGSQRAFDMLMKVRTLQGMRSGGVSFLTGTPVSNSLVEIYAMMKYLVPESLEAMNIQSFDSWKAAFIEDQSRFEYTASMQLKERNVMSGMINLGPLAQLYRSFADIVMRPDVERMYREQKEAENAAQTDPEKIVSTRFPTPKVKGGARQINLAPPTEKMQEFVRYLVMRMAGIKKNKSSKEYMSTDNPLWVLTDARKASVDIRTIDPTLGREEGSKVERASDEVFRIWEANKDRKGTQMVFSDMSAPTKTAEVDAKRILKLAYEKLGLKRADITKRAADEADMTYAERWGNVIEDLENAISSPDTDEKRRDRLNEFVESEAVQDASSAMFTADTGFSFYDDMKAALIEKGVPEKEIAFIHDYNTTIKKAELFEAVNEGAVRVLIGSTQKMGAGTNAQKRMVALHHIDAPWRPSDMEQREGRIIRQGNLFYEADPDGFEVEIIAYSTEQTADVVQWQVLERKASSIETFLNAATDSIEEEGGDADQYAEFMAQSTGKEVFLQKMQAEKDRDTEQARIASTIRNLAEAERYLAGYDNSQDFYQMFSEAYGKVTLATMFDGADTYLSGWEAEVETYRAEKERIEAERDEVRARNADKPRKEWEKLPELPSAPSRWEEPPAGGWERIVYDALSKAQSRAQDQIITLSPEFEITIAVKDQGGGTLSYAPYLTATGNRVLQQEPLRLVDGFGTVDAKDFRRSDKLLNALSPANIVSRAETRAARYARDKQRHAELKPQMESIKEKGVDRAPLEAAQQRLDRLSALVRIEEVKFATETASAGPNYFAARDDKGRDLVADDTAQPLTGQFQFTNAGQNYASEWGAPGGTRRIEGTDRTGQIVFFEAENMDTGEQVVIEAIETKKAEGDKPAEWDVLNVYDNDPLADMTPEELERLDRALTSLGITSNKVEDEMRLDDDGNPNVRASMSNPKARRADFNAAAGDVITSTPEARKAMRKVRRALRDELNKIGIGARITLDVREGVIDTFPGIGPMDGYFLDGVIGIAADTPGGYMGVLRHEVIHALRNPELWGKDHGLFTAQEWRTLVRAARQNTRLMDQVNADYDGLSDAAKIEEVIAEMFREWSDGKDTQTALGRAFDKLRQILDAIITALRGEGLNDAAAVFERVRSGEIGGRGPDGPGRATVSNRQQPSEVKARIATPRDAGRISVQARNLRAGISQLASDAVTNAMKDRGGYNTLALVPGRALFNELGKGIPAAKRYLRLKEKMDTKRNDKHAETDEVAQKWRKLANKDKDANAELMKLMHDSTIAGVDPSERFVSPMGPRDELIIKSGRVANPIAYEAALERKERHERLQKAHDELSPRFKALPEGFQELYRDVRDTYRRLDDEQTAAIIGNVERAMTLAIRRAEREHRRSVETAEKNHAGALRKIAADKTMSGTERATRRAQADMKRDQAIADADETLAKAKATRAWTKDSQVRKLRSQFETNKISGPYFPLARFGEYFVLARDDEGNVQSFSRYETVQQQRAAQKDMEDEGFDVQIGVMQETDARDLVDPAFVADIERMLEEVNADEKLMDDIWQRWLESLPDMSIRKHRIHRKNREGYDADALRAFGHHMFHGSHQLARLLYSLEMQEELDVASEEAASSEDPVRNGFIVNEMKRRHGFTMNPKGAWWASKATSLAFIYYLSVSPAAAIVNLSQTSIVGTSVLGRYGGTKKAAGALTKALADFTRSPKWHSERNTKHLSADERAAMHEAYKRGVIDKTQSHDLAQVAESGVEYDAKWVNVMSKISWLFHHSERMNREVTFLAGYRLLREQGKTHEQAITQAGDATWEVHFDYQNTSKPRVMQSPGMQVLLTFRNFSVNFLWRIFRDLHQAVNGADADTRKEARRQAGVMASMMLFHAGIKGVYGYGLVMALLGMFFPDDEDDPEERLEKLMLDYLPRPVARAMLDGVPGTLGGIDLTGRIGMPNLWFRDSLRPLEGADLYQHYVNEVIGPIPAIGMNIATGASRVIDGAALRDGSLVWRGVETAMPKAVRDVMKGGRYAYEGALTYNGDPIKDDFSAWEVIAQVSGFTPKELVDQYDQNGRLKNKERAITNRRRNVIKQAAEQIKDGKPLTPRQMRLIEEFNRDYPEWPITNATLNRSVQGRINRSERNEAGVSVNPRLEPRLRASLSPLVADG
jgi:N12 class adenine-specific DNA methylase